MNGFLTLTLLTIGATSFNDMRGKAWSEYIHCAFDVLLNNQSLWSSGIDTSVLVHHLGDVLVLGVQILLHLGDPTLVGRIVPHPGLSYPGSLGGSLGACPPPGECTVSHILQENMSGRFIGGDSWCDDSSSLGPFVSSSGPSTVLSICFSSSFFSVFSSSVASSLSSL